MKRREGYLTILVYMSVVVMGIAAGGVQLSVGWVKEAVNRQRGIESLLAENFQSNFTAEKLPLRASGNEKNIIWWLFLRDNLTPLREMLDFKQNIKKMRSETGVWVRNNAHKNITEPDFILQAGQGYKKYLERLDNEDTDTAYVWPVIKDIPEERLKTGYGISDDSVKAYLIKTNNNRRIYPEDVLTENIEISEFYNNTNRGQQGDMDMFMSPNM